MTEENSIDEGTIQEGAEAITEGAEEIQIRRVAQRMLKFGRK